MRNVTMWVINLVKDLPAFNDWAWGHYVYKTTLYYPRQGFGYPALKWGSLWQDTTYTVFVGATVAGCLLSPVLLAESRDCVSRACVRGLKLRLSRNLELAVFFESLWL
ncbi:hypothetical protein ACOSQ4_028607 [Xanthoceras sorbifolium]